MDGILTNQVLWGIAAWRLVAALALIFIGFLSRRVVRVLFGRVLKKRAGRTQIKWDDDVVELLPSPAALVIQVLLWYAVAVVLVLPQEPTDIRSFIFSGLQIALAIAATWIVFRLVDVLGRASERMSDRTDTKLDDQAIPLLRKSLKVFIGITVGVMVVQQLGYSVTSLIASLGIGGLALALAAKDMVANFFGSVLVFTDRPFQIGDAVSVGGVEGVVEEVGFRTTRIRQFDRALVTVPNQTFSSASITNLSARQCRRIRFVLGVGYDATPGQVGELVEALRGLVGQHPGIDAGNYLVNFQAFGDSSLEVLVNCYTTTADYAAYMDAQQALLLRVMEVVDQMGLEIAFPTRTVYLRSDAEAAGDGVT
jgi:MscS family membrane protein